jgi:hypothetical protein
MNGIRIGNILDVICAKTMVCKLPIRSAISGAMINEIAVMILDMPNTIPKLDADA